MVVTLVGALNITELFTPTAEQTSRPPSASARPPPGRPVQEGGPAGVPGQGLLPTLDMCTPRWACPGAESGICCLTGPGANPPPRLRPRLMGREDNTLAKDLFFLSLFSPKEIKETCGWQIC